jgi:hypothetical protein
MPLAGETREFLTGKRMAARCQRYFTDHVKGIKND